MSVLPPELSAVRWKTARQMLRFHLEEYYRHEHGTVRAEFLGLKVHVTSLQMIEARSIQMAQRKLEILYCENDQEKADLRLEVAQLDESIDRIRAQALRQMLANGEDREWIAIGKLSTDAPFALVPARRWASLELDVENDRAAKDGIKYHALKFEHWCELSEEAKQALERPIRNRKVGRPPSSINELLTEYKRRQNLGERYKSESAWAEVLYTSGHDRGMLNVPSVGTIRKAIGKLKKP